MIDSELLFDVEALIKGYEEGLSRSFATDPSSSNASLAYNAPLLGMEVSLEGFLVSSDINLMDVLAPSLGTKRSSPERSRNNSSEDERGNFYAECDYVDEDNNEQKEWYEPSYEGATLSKPIAKAKIRNQLNLALGANLTKYTDESLKEKEINFSVEECLNCTLNINLKIVEPAIEFAFDFTKVLNQIKQLLNSIEQSLDPTRLFAQLCNFKKAFGDNLICPSNLIGLNILLPNLFVKYSMDLLDVKFDWTTVFGPLITGFLNAYQNLIGNIKQPINAFFDCIINALITFKNYLLTIDKSAVNILNQGKGALNEIASALDAVGIVDIDTPASVKPSGKQSSSKETSVSNADSASNLEKRVISNFISFIKRGKYRYSNYNELVGIFSNYIYETLHKKEVSDQERDDIWSYFDGDINNDNIPEKLKKSMSALDINKYDFRYMVQNDYRDDEGRTLEEKLAPTSPKRELINPKEEKAVKNKFKSEFYRDRSFVQENLARYKLGDSDKNKDTIASYNTSVSESEYSTLNKIFAKYGISASLEYNDKQALPEINEPFLTDFYKTLDVWINSAKESKESYLKSIDKINILTKGISSFVNEGVEVEVKVLGQIQSLLHLIRFIRLLIELTSNGFDNCEKIKDNKQVFKKVIGSLNSDLILEENKNALTNNEDILLVRSKNNKYSTEINLNDCSDVFNHIKVSEDNLDLIYEGLKNYE